MSLVAISGNASGTGTLTIAAPNTNSNYTLTLPAATGTVMVSGNMPAFSAYAGTTTSVTANTFTKVAFNTEVFDTANCFDSTTNYRFTPTVGGYYQVNVGLQPTAAFSLFAVLYKNGSIYQYGIPANPLNVGGIYGGGGLNTLVFLNGSTDYIEIYAYCGNNITITTGAEKTWFNGLLVRLT
jgi:hypothetical protein